MHAPLLHRAPNLVLACPFKENYFFEFENNMLISYYYERVGILRMKSHLAIPNQVIEVIVDPKLCMKYLRISR